MSNIMQFISLKTLFFVFLLILFTELPVTSGDSPELVFKTSGKYSVIAEVNEWKKQSLFFWRSENIIFHYQIKNRFYSVSGFDTKNGVLQVPVRQSNFDGQAIPLLIKSPKAPDTLFFSCDIHINSPNVAPITKSMFTLKGHPPNIFAYVSDVANPHFYLSFMQGHVPKGFIKKEKSAYGFQFHDNKMHNIKGEIYWYEWKQLVQNPNICCAVLYTTIIDNNVYQGFKHKRNTHYVDVKKKYVNSHQGDGITICIDSGINSGTLQLKAQWHGRKGQNFKKINISDFNFLDYPTYRIENIIYDYSQDKPSMRLHVSQKKTGLIVNTKQVATKQAKTISQKNAYGILVDQYHQKCNLYGQISSLEWNKHTTHNWYCAKLILMKMDGKKFSSFQYHDNQYLMHISPRYENMNQGKPIEICVDTKKKPEKLEIHLQISAKRRPIVQNFNPSHFTLFPKNRYIKKVEYDCLPDKPSLLLRLNESVARSQELPKQYISQPPVNKSAQVYHTVQEVYEKLILKNHFYCSKNNSHQHRQAIKIIAHHNRQSVNQIDQQMKRFEWQNAYKLDFLDNQAEYLDNFSWTHVISENIQRPFLNIKFNILKSTPDPISYKDARRQITQYNLKKPQKNIWRIPNLDLLFHFFQLKSFTENHHRYLNLQLPETNEEMRFWTSSVTNKDLNNSLHWVIVVHIHHENNIGKTNYRTFDYRLTFKTIKKHEHAYLMAVSDIKN